MVGIDKLDDPDGLFLLGGFVVAIGGVAPAGISTDSQRLLAFLALGQPGTTGNGVAAALWPQSSAAHADSRLRQAVARLEGPARQAVKVTGGELGLAEGVVVDVHRSRSLAQRLISGDAQLADDEIGVLAVSALSEDLLPGWYDDWAVIAAEDWRHLRIRALEAVAARLTAADRLAEAAAAARAAVQAEPLREGARAALIRVYMAEGNHSEAFGEFERYRILLQTAIGVVPTSRLSGLLPGSGLR